LLIKISVPTILDKTNIHVMENSDMFTISFENSKDYPILCDMFCSNTEILEIIEDKIKILPFKKFDFPIKIKTFSKEKILVYLFQSDLMEKPIKTYEISLIF